MTQRQRQRKPIDELSDAMKRRRFQDLRHVLGSCERCGAPATQRHHKDGDLDNITVENMEELCNGCHGERHQGRKVTPRIPDGMLPLSKAIEIVGYKHASQLRRLAQRGDLTTMRLPDGTWLTTRAWLEDWMTYRRRPRGKPGHRANWKPPQREAVAS